MLTRLSLFGLASILLLTRVGLLAVLLPRRLAADGQLILHVLNASDVRDRLLGLVSLVLVVHGAVEHDVALGNVDIDGVGVHHVNDLPARQLLLKLHGDLMSEHFVVGAALPLSHLLTLLSGDIPEGLVLCALTGNLQLVLHILHAANGSDDLLGLSFLIVVLDRPMQLDRPLGDMEVDRLGIHDVDRLVRRQLLLELRIVLTARPGADVQAIIHLPDAGDAVDRLLDLAFLLLVRHSSQEDHSITEGQNHDLALLAEAFLANLAGDLPFELLIAVLPHARRLASLGGTLPLLPRALVLRRHRALLSALIRLLLLLPVL